MKKILIGFLALILLNSCATIVGGAKYKALVHVENCDNCDIYYKGQSINNNSQLLIRRLDANKITFRVKQKGYKTEKFHFRKMSFRGSAFTASLLCSYFTRYNETDIFGNITKSVIVPVQIIIDLLNVSSLFKPNVGEWGVSKINYKNYKYHLDYKAVAINPPKKEEKIEEKEIIKDEYTSITDKLRDLKNLHNEGIINDEEYDHLKKKVIGMSSNNSIGNDAIIIPESELINEDIEVITDDEKVESTPVEAEEKKLSDEDQEKLNDLNKMKELGIISEKEYQEMKAKLIDNK